MLRGAVRLDGKTVDAPDRVGGKNAESSSIPVDAAVVAEADEVAEAALGRDIIEAKLNDIFGASDTSSFMRLLISDSGEVDSLLPALALSASAAACCCCCCKRAS